PAAGLPTPAATPTALQLRALRDFLECPLQGSAAAVLGLRRDDGDDPARVASEVFRTSARDETVRLRDALARAARRRERATDVYRELARRRALAGAAPLGLLGELERNLHSELLAGWEEHIEDLLQLGRGERLRVGRVPEHEEVDGVLPPLVLPLPGGDGAVELHGRSELLVAERRATVIADPGTTKEPREEEVREL